MTAAESSPTVFAGPMPCHNIPVKVSRNSSDVMLKMKMKGPHIKGSIPTAQHSVCAVKSTAQNVANKLCKVFLSL